MEQEQGMAISGEGYLPGEDASGGTDGIALKDRTGPTWRGFALSILAAIVLSVLATLLFGGSWSSSPLRAASAVSSAGCGAGGSCCPPAETGK